MKAGYLFPFILISTTALAHSADLPEFPPAIPPIIEDSIPGQWSGPYLGLHAGYAIGKGEFDFCCFQYTDNFPGGRIGGFAGYNWQFSKNLVAGIEADATRDFNGMTATASEVGSEWSKSIRLKLGRPYKNTLLYVAAGWTQTDIYERDFDETHTANGWTLGAGVDWAVSSAVFIRTEYRYNDYETIKLADIDTNFSQSTINIGVGFRF